VSGRANVLDHNSELLALAQLQSYVVSRHQLGGCAVSADAVAYHIKARRWREPVPGVVVMHCGPLTEQARIWLAILAGGPDAALCAWSALTAHGVEGWARPNVHLVVRRGRHVPAIDLLVVHESRRHRASDVCLRDGVPTHAVERAAVDAGAWSATVRSACGVLAAVVQQGLTTPARLLAALDTAGRVRHRSQMFHALCDIEGGSQAMSEIDLIRLCRRAGLREPARQRVRTDDRGRRRYLDAEWVLPGGRRVVLEVDGILHMEVGRWYDDLLRQSELAVPGRDWVLRIPASALRLEPERVVAILRRAFVSLAA
jgi:hypothetical protein